MGQQGTLTRVWAKRGTRPRAPRDTRYQWAYLFGAVCPGRGTAAGLVLPFADTAAMNAHLAEIAATVAPGAHAVLVLDGAGWHGGKDLVVPDNISLLTLPPLRARAQPRRKRLAIPPRQQARDLRLRRLRRHCGRLLHRLELFRQRPNYRHLHNIPIMGRGQPVGPLVLD